jgi:hypothetical protein
MSYIRESNTQGVADITFFFGNPGDVPLVGDFNNDGKDTISIWRPSLARVYIINELGEDGKGLGAADYFFDFGNPGDSPVVGDWDGDGVDDEFFFGDPGDQVIAGDWDGDGDDTVGVYRPSTGRLYIKYENGSGAADWSTDVTGDPIAVVTAGRVNPT